MDYDKVWVLGDKFTLVIPSDYLPGEQSYTYEGDSTIRIYFKELNVDEYQGLSALQEKSKTIDVDVDTFINMDDDRQRVVKFSRIIEGKEYINLGYIFAGDLAYIIDVEYDSSNQNDADEAMKIINSISVSNE